MNIGVEISAACRFAARRPLGVSKGPIQLPGLCIDGATRERAIINPRHRNYFRIVSCREDLVCRPEILISKTLLHDFHAVVAQQCDYTVAGNPSEKGPICNRREDQSVFGHEDIRGCKLSYITEHVADYCIVITSPMGLKQRTRVVGIETSGLGVNRHSLEGWPTIGRQSDRETFRSPHGRFVNRQTPASRLRIMCLNPRSFLFRPIHGPDIESDIFAEPRYPLPREIDPGFCRDRWF